MYDCHTYCEVYTKQDEVIVHEKKQIKETNNTQNNSRSNNKAQQSFIFNTIEYTHANIMFYKLEN